MWALKLNWLLQRFHRAPFRFGKRNFPPNPNNRGKKVHLIDPSADHHLESHRPSQDHPIDPALDNHLESPRGYFQDNLIDPAPDHHLNNIKRFHRAPFRFGKKNFPQSPNEHGKMVPFIDPSADHNLESPRPSQNYPIDPAPNHHLNDIKPSLENFNNPSRTSLDHLVDRPRPYLKQLLDSLLAHFLDVPLDQSKYRLHFSPRPEGSRALPLNLQTAKLPLSVLMRVSGSMSVQTAPKLPWSHLASRCRTPSTTKGLLKQVRPSTTTEGHLLKHMRPSTTAEGRLLKHERPSTTAEGRRPRRNSKLHVPSTTSQLEDLFKRSVWCSCDTWFSGKQMNNVCDLERN